MIHRIFVPENNIWNYDMKSLRNVLSRLRPLISKLLQLMLKHPLSAIDGKSTFEVVLAYILYAFVLLMLSLLLWFLPSCTVTLSVQKNNNNSTQSSESSSTSSVDSTSIQLQPNQF